MPTIARVADETTEIFTEGETFRFDGGTRQVSQADRQALERYAINGGPATVTFEETTSTKKGGK